MLFTSATALLEKVPPRLVTHVHFPGGHVGAMTSRAAATGLWPELGGWFLGGHALAAAPSRLRPASTRDLLPTTT